MQISPELSVQRELLVDSGAEDVDVVTKESLVPRVLAPGEEEIVQCVHQIVIIPSESVPVPTSHVTRHTVHCCNWVHSEPNDELRASSATYFNIFTPGRFSQIRLKRHGQWAERTGKFGRDGSTGVGQFQTKFVVQVIESSPKLQAPTWPRAMNANRSADVTLRSTSDQLVRSGCQSHDSLPGHQRATRKESRRRRDRWEQTSSFAAASCSPAGHLVVFLFSRKIIFN